MQLLRLAAGVMAGLIVAFALGGAASGESEAGAGPVKLPIGMNLAGFNDYSPGYPFKNLLWGARPWMTRNADGSGKFNTELAEVMPLDAEGYPTEVPFQAPGAGQPQTVFTVIPNVTEPGRHVVLFDGDGEIGAAMSTKVVETKPGRVVLELSCKAGDEAYEGISIKRSAKGNHVRNVRVLALADEKADLGQNPFREDFLAYCRQWHALRFMDWQATNDSLEREWGARKKPGFYTMVGSGGDAIGRWGKPPSAFERRFSGGAALEIIIQLANMTKTDPWVCVPHRATEEYMTEMARLLKAKLDPKLKVYVEYSNEVWNWQFKQAQWMLQSKIAADALAGTGVSGWKDGKAPTEFPYEEGTVAKDGGSDHPERIAVLARRAFAAFEGVFTGADRARLVRVLGVQHSWEDVARRTAKWTVEHGGADAIAPAGYFGPNDEIYARWEAAGAKLTAEQVAKDMDEAFEKDSAKWTRAVAKIAKESKLRYVVYEGGQHIQPKGQAETAYMPALKAAQFHPDLAKVYAKNLALHKEIGCELFVAFSSIGRQGTRYGSWGHQERYGQTGAEIPKFGALVEANAEKMAR